ncbi:type IV toxin-antitoxin system AbiEi family antitoxin [Endozoicomonas euniceicola]|uniref:Type IV toxin-antitoxin system AbiEi family antitoxin domain-containing protein n=1 Tax=Endozoicomonas euniceicola TaxID=1234143 RepID=A0ABY6GU88_9GAMM|nr:type IV toxin-antitoxin system AbiEi family antitoxin domain-containing protein [Endozoicomonas euniceicola]UYM16127.1 type IV toxin-antitoxin system AbiEi family antitoxin domain-containing protein [Endozoicomonas euniceicola]
MNQSIAIKRLNELDRQGRYVFTLRDIGKVFAEDTGKTLQAGLNRLIKQGFLIRAIKGIYVFALSRQKGNDTLELIAKTMRRGEYSYLSLESALAEYGVISQIPIDRLTVMTTGRKGEYKTPFGTIEFTHTKRSAAEIINSIKSVGRPLRLATKEAAWRDLKRVGRNTHLVNEQAIDED